MCNLNALARNSVTAQERMFRLAERDHGLSIAALSLETGIPRNTLAGWKNGATMPAWALGALGRAGVPNHLLSLTLHPFHRHIGTDGSEEGAFHDAAMGAGEYNQEFLSATAPDSEMGPDLSPREKARLGEVAMRAGGRLRAVAG